MKDQLVQYFLRLIRTKFEEIADRMNNFIEGQRAGHCAGRMLACSYTQLMVLLLTCLSFGDCGGLRSLIVALHEELPVIVLQGIVNCLIFTCTLAADEQTQ